MYYTPIYLKPLTGVKLTDTAHLFPIFYLIRKSRCSFLTDTFPLRFFKL